MIKLRKQPVAPYNPWDFGREVGERVYEPQPNQEGAYIYDVVESNGRNKAAIGELTSRLVKKNGKPRLAVLCDDGNWYWDD